MFSLNAWKTLRMVYLRAMTKNNVIDDVIIDDDVLTRVSSVKYRGAIIDHKLAQLERSHCIYNYFE